MPAGTAPPVRLRVPAHAEARVSLRMCETRGGRVVRTGRPYAGFCPALAVTAISLGPTLPPASSGPPEDSASSLVVLCLTLLRARFTERIRSPGPLVVSYTTVSPLPTSPPAVCFLWHCLADCSGWVLPTALLCGARTFLGTPGGVTRPSHRPVRTSDCTGSPGRECASAAASRGSTMSASRAARSVSPDPRRDDRGGSWNLGDGGRARRGCGRTTRRRRAGPDYLLVAARVAAPMIPALLRSVAGMISACRSSSGRNSSWCFDTPPPTTKSSGESSASSVE